MTIAFRAMPRAPRSHGDTMQFACSSPLVVVAFRGLLSPVATGLWFVLVRAHPLPCVDLCIFPVYAGYCRRLGRGFNTGLAVFARRAMVGVAAVPGGVQIRGSLSLVCKAAAAFALKHAELLKFALVLPRFVNDGFGTVRMCVAGGVDANVYTCFSVGGTGLNGVIDGVFYNAGCIEDPRVAIIFCFSPGGSGWSSCPAALSLLRGFGAAWSSVLEARTCLLSLSVLCVSLLLTVSSPLCCFRSGPGVCRRPGRGKNRGLPQLASHEDLSGLTLCSFVLTASATLRVCWRVP